MLECNFNIGVIFLLQVEKECEDFEKVYHSVEQGLKCQFETLNILADQGAIMYLKAYLEGIQTRFVLIMLHVTLTSISVIKLLDSNLQNYKCSLFLYEIRPNKV